MGLKGSPGPPAYRFASDVKVGRDIISAGQRAYQFNISWSVSVRQIYCTLVREGRLLCYMPAVPGAAADWLIYNAQTAGFPAMPPQSQPIFRGGPPAELIEDKSADASNAPSYRAVFVGATAQAFIVRVETDPPNVRSQNLTLERESDGAVLFDFLGRRLRLTEADGKLASVNEIEKAPGVETATQRTRRERDSFSPLVQFVEEEIDVAVKELRPGDVAFSLRIRSGPQKRQAGSANGDPKFGGAGSALFPVAVGSVVTYCTAARPPAVAYCLADEDGDGAAERLFADVAFGQSALYPINIGNSQRVMQPVRLEEAANISTLEERLDVYYLEASTQDYTAFNKGMVRVAMFRAALVPLGSQTGRVLPTSVGFGHPSNKATLRGDAGAPIAEIEVPTRGDRIKFRRLQSVAPGVRPLDRYLEGKAPPP